MFRLDAHVDVGWGCQSSAVFLASIVRLAVGLVLVVGLANVVCFPAMRAGQLGWVEKG